MALGLIGLVSCGSRQVGVCTFGGPQRVAPWSVACLIVKNFYLMHSGRQDPGDYNMLVVGPGAEAS